MGAKTLTKLLRDLEEGGDLSRTPIFDEIGRATALYELTAEGHRLATLIDALQAWLAEDRAAIERAA